MGAGYFILWFFFLALLFGAVFGILSGFLAKRRDPGSLVTRSLIGFFGGLIAGIVLFEMAGNGSLPASLNTGVAPTAGVIALGTIIMLLLYSITFGKGKNKIG